MVSLSETVEGAFRYHHDAASALAIAFNEVARQSIMADPNWNHGTT
jgi:homoserine acetyltransferase